MQGIPFEKVLELFESHGWVLKECWGDHRVFIDPNDIKKLPWLFPVRDRKVSIEYYNRILRFFEDENKNTKKSRRGF